MNKKIYFIAAIIISVLLTVLQSVVINKKYTKDMTRVYVALDDISEGSVIKDECYKEEKVYGSNLINTYPKESLTSSIAVTAIKKGEIITLNDFNQNMEIESNRYIALKINGENFNANDIKAYDYVDLYFIPDLEHMKAYQFTWLKAMVKEYNIDYSPELEVGLFIRNVQIAYIDNNNNQAQYISLKLKSPFDELVSFLKMNGSYDVIKIN